MSLPRTIGALFGALAILLGFLILVGWAVHSSLLTHVAPDLLPTQRDTAIGFVLSGLALLGIVWSRPRLRISRLGHHGDFGCGLASREAVPCPSWDRRTQGRCRWSTALCFLVLASGFVLAEISPLSKGPPILGVAGVLVGAVAAACGIGVVWGGGNAFGLGDFTRMALPTTAGFVLLGTGAMAWLWT